MSTSAIQLAELDRCSASQVPEVAARQIAAAAAASAGWRTCVGGCHTTSGDVQIRRTPDPLQLCPSCWESN